MDEGDGGEKWEEEGRGKGGVYRKEEMGRGRRGKGDERKMVRTQIWAVSGQGLRVHRSASILPFTHSFSLRGSLGDD